MRDTGVVHCSSGVSRILYRGVLDSLRVKNFATTPIFNGPRPSIKESAHAHNGVPRSYTLVGVVWCAILRKLIILSI